MEQATKPVNVRLLALWAAIVIIIVGVLPFLLATTANWSTSCPPGGDALTHTACFR